MNTQRLLEDKLKEYKPKKGVMTKEVINKKYFLKITGKDRIENLENEMKALQKLKTISTFYKNYFIDSKKYKGNLAILVKYISSKDLLFLFNCDFSINILLDLYKLLLNTIKVYHDNHFIHGDIKPENFIFYFDKSTKKPEIQLIDVESVIDFNELEKKNRYIQILTELYVPFSGELVYEINNTQLPVASESFFKYRDLYGISLIILFLYKKDLYKKISENKPKKKRNFGFNHWTIDDKITYPSDYINPKNNKLEKILFTLFSALDRKSINDYKLNDNPTLLPNVDDILKLFK